MKKLFAILLVALIMGSFQLYKPALSPTSPFECYEDLIPGTYRIGFTDLNKETYHERVPVQGTIPHWLSGTLFRNGPAKWTQSNNFVNNWFDGLAMLHAFSFQDGVVLYTNKFLKSDDYQYAQKTGKMNYAGFVQDPCRSYFKWVMSWFEKSIPIMPNANVNVARYTNNFIALTETPMPIQFDPHTLETIGGLQYTDELPQKDIHDTPHPHYDFDRKEHLGYFTTFGRVCSHNLFRIKDGDVKREIIASLQVEEPSYMHSFAITKNYAILTLLPLVVSHPWEFLLPKKAFIKYFKWKPDLGTRLLVIDRINNNIIGVYETAPFFAFHTVNAFEKDDSIILDIITYSNDNIIRKSLFDTLLAPLSVDAVQESSQVSLSEKSKLMRYTISLKDKVVNAHRIIDEVVELPTINYEQYNGRDYTFVYAFAQKQAGFPNDYVADQLVKVNVKTGTMLTWSEDNCYPGEPIFVPEPNASQEDQGIVVSVVLDATRERSFLLMLNARDFKEIARAMMPHNIPFGIHGKFYK